MIVSFILASIIYVLNSTFSGLPTVTTLPIISSFDIDSAFSSAFGLMYRVADVFWPLSILFNAVLVVVGYYAIKLLLRFILGQRAPGTA